MSDGRDYSQNGEQAVILAAVADIKQGRLLEIGAYDGLAFSNTLALIEQGWSGVLVEPGIDAFKSLLSRHGSNVKLSLVQAVVGPHRDFVQFWNSADALSTTSQHNVNIWKDVAKFNAPYWVPQLSLQELLDKFKGAPFDVVSIDTEGMSATLFHKFMQLCYPDYPKVIVVEHDKQQAACVSVVGARYEVAMENGENLVFVRRDKR